MRTHIKFIILSFLKSFLNVFLVMLSLVFILNILQEIEFFSSKNVGSYYPIYLSLMNTPSIIFEMFPFIFLISTQFYFIKLFNNDEINIFKYSGLKNLKIILILSISSFVIGVGIITMYYNLSSTLQSYYLEIKNQYSSDKSDYLAVINKNGLWIKDIVNDEINIINSSKINNNILSETFISTFDKNYELLKNIRSDKIDIKNNKWLIYDASIFEDNTTKKVDILEFQTNFNQRKIESLFSNLSSLSILKLLDLRKNYKTLNYSLIDVDLQLNKIFTYPFYLMLMTIFSSIIMFNTKKFKSSTFKVVIGLFCSVIIYYVSNFFNVMGVTEKIPLTFSIFSPLIILCILNTLLLVNINDK